MPTARHILTLHSPVTDDVRDSLLSSIEEALEGLGASHVWIDPGTRPDIAVMAELADDPAADLRLDEPEDLRIASAPCSAGVAPR